MSSRGDYGSQCFVTTQAEKGRWLEGLQQIQRLEAQRVDQQPVGYASQLEQVEGSIQAVDLILAQLARQENGLSDLLEKDQSSRDWKILEDRRAKIRIEAMEALKMIL